MVVATLFSGGCGGTPPLAPTEPTPPPVEEPPPAVEEPPPPPVEPADEPPPEPPPAEEPAPASTEPPPPPEPVCADLGEGRCKVTEGCEWHSIKKCLEQEKPKTLGD
jgi:hypothetical protein